MVAPVVRVQAEPFDAAEESRLITAWPHGCRGGCHLHGFVPERGRKPRCSGAGALPWDGEDDELVRVAGEALARWPLQGVTVIHRYGKIEPGEPIVLVVTASAHRRAAFESADFLMDYLKTRAPFWKKEHFASGAEGGWVAAKSEDDQAAERW